MLIDSHCHVQFQGFDEDRDAVLKRCQEKNMVLNLVGTQKDTSQQGVLLAQQHDNIYATIGLHPIHVFKTRVEEEQDAFHSRGEDFDENFYNNLAQSPKVIAFGETGLDLFHIPKHLSEEEVLIRQKEVFTQHYNCAKKNDLPLVLHVRDAHAQMIEFLKTFNEPIRAVVHCYTGNWEYAQEYLKLGCYLGFTGVVTFPPKKTDPLPQVALTEVIDNCPIDRILVETDAPYLAPQKYRGKKCEPWMTEEVVRWIAQRRGISYEVFRAQSVTNTRALFTKIQKPLQ